MCVVWHTRPCFLPNLPSLHAYNKWFHERIPCKACHRGNCVWNIRLSGFGLCCSVVILLTCIKSPELTSCHQACGEWLWSDVQGYVCSPIYFPSWPQCLLSNHEWVPGKTCFHGKYIQVWGVLFSRDLADVDKNPKSKLHCQGMAVVWRTRHDCSPATSLHDI